jgi:hypothetical protein
MQDTINGLFECLAGLFIAASCRRLWLDKKVHGVSLAHPVFFNVWGFWNLYFYPCVGCWWSFLGGIGVVAANTLWSLMLVYYSIKTRNRD